ncbi:MAG: DUF805 domain-containing protein [Gammaproteobacteria bacterium]|nr:DUF805 domain-containing protein [Gammaproteobacteria bacterium]
MKDENLYKSPESEIVNKIDDFGDASFFAMTRIGRVRWLAYNFLFFIIIFALLLGIIALTGAMHLEGSILFYVFFATANVILSIRRLHDMEFTGWISVFIPIPYINIPFILFLLFAHGTDDENKYGKQPPPNDVTTYLLALAFIVLVCIAALLSAILVRI